MNIQSKIKLKDFLFYIAITFYCADYYISASLFDYKVPNILSLLLQIVVLICLVIKWIFTERYTWKKLVAVFVIIISAGIVAFTGQYNSLLLFMCLVMSSSNIEFDEIIKLLEINVWFWMILIILSCKVGLLQDYTYAHYTGNILYTAHSLGFKYYGWVGYGIMALSMMWIYRHKGANFVQTALIIGLNYVFYRIHTTNLALIITALFVVMCYCTEKLKIVNLTSKIWKVIACAMPCALYSLTWITIWLYKSGKVLFLIPILRTIVARLKYSIKALDIYGLHIFGTHVTQIGNVEINYQNVSSTNAIYIDSGFVYSTIAYGILFTIVLLVIYTWLGVYLYKNNQRILYIWLLIMMVACCINNFMCDIINNPIIFLLPSAVFSAKKTKKRKEHFKKKKIKMMQSKLNI